MTQALPQLVTFDEFLAWYPENRTVRYELHDGEIVEMPKPTGTHSKLTGFIIDELNFKIREIDKRGIWFIPRECIVKPRTGKSGYEPDIIVLNEETIGLETRWEKESVIEHASSVKLIVEVVSTNWRDDYLKKLADYEEMGIPEYWIVDYKGLGGKLIIGNPKQPSISVYVLEDDEYKLTQFRGDEIINSPTFPDLKLSVNQILRFGVG